MWAGIKREGWRGVGFFDPLGYGEGVRDDFGIWENGGGDGVDLLACWGEGWWGGAGMVLGLGLV